MTTFYAPGEWDAEVELGDAAAHHANVKRLAVGEAVRLTNGAGVLADATIALLGKRSLRVAVADGSRREVPRPPEVELWVPVGDRDRMLWLAEKATELGVSSWRPVVYQRSRSVTPRGEGEAFRARVDARMIGALEQSGGAWLPSRAQEQPLDAVLAHQADGVRILLDAAGNPMRSLLESMRRDDAARRATIIALGPEGGLEAREREQFLAAGWQPASLGRNILRFETAAIAALALVRLLDPASE